MRKNPKILGDQSENIALGFLRDEGFLILETNYFARKLGEIDIIASKDEVLHFIEVKSAKADFDPIYNLSTSKLKKIVKSAYYYLKVKKLNLAFCIDAIIIRNEELEFIENITL